ncbi:MULTISPECIES: hypothetical protein [Mycolicibacterium]|uniref:Uncharacterized protein n=1 Tax=Mycolicibacterium canariasense TaxID=228230 RepID=A0A100WBB4_MYCCR|nr:MULTISPECIES: hypothetical protein [Mycolicibacterium]MCC9179545.1 hypothetical protein [Mycolicibacterium mageritense]MCV7211450.1 hypothetical protein [Mycolicibacterium canariasense]GAS94888.1 uncharacterized protein RMCC_1854 [Mycolicibacterium canariasense]
MRTYRADVSAAAAAAEVAGPHTLEVIATAPTSALAALATELGLNPHTISTVSPAARVNHDIATTLRAFTAARKADLAESAATVAATVTSSTTGSLPVRVPAPGQEPSVAVLAKVELDTFAAPNLAAQINGAGGPHASADELDAVDAEVADKRRHYTGLCVAAARAQRRDVDPDELQSWRDHEAAALAEAEGPGQSTSQSTSRSKSRSKPRSHVDFRTVDGDELSLPLSNVREVTAAYGRLTGTTDIGATHFADPDAADAATAFAAHLGNCYTPAEAIGADNWNSYLTRAKGDIETARHAVAEDALELSESAALSYLTRLPSDDPKHRPLEYRNSRGLDKVCSPDLAHRIEVVANGWMADTGAAWAELPAADPGPRRILMDTLLEPRHIITGDPFDHYDLPTGVPGSGGVYGPEQGAVEEISRGVRELRNSSAPVAEAVADAICEAAHRTRELPSGTLAQRTERQWRLVELAEAAERMALDPDNIKDVTVVPFDDPNQMALFDGDAQGAA